MLSNETVRKLHDMRLSVKAEASCAYLQKAHNVIILGAPEPE